MEVDNCVAWVEDEKGLVIINTKTQKGIVLDEIGYAIWTDLLDTSSLEKTVINFIATYSDESPEVISEDVTSVFDTLVENGIILTEGLGDDC